VAAQGGNERLYRRSFALSLRRAGVGKEIGPIAKPDEIRFGDNLPKTRSGKIMRRLLRAIAKGEEITRAAEGSQVGRR
jgi:acetyl-CoA synthetase